MNKYLKITQEFAEQKKRHKIGRNRFGYGVTISGDYVCALQSKIDLPAIFQGQNFEEVELGVEDFPKIEIE